MKETGAYAGRAVAILTAVVLLASTAHSYRHVALRQADLPYDAQSKDSITFVGDTIRVSTGRAIYVDNHDEYYHIVGVNGKDSVFINFGGTVIFFDENGGAGSRFQAGIVVTGSGATPADHVTITGGSIIRDVGPGEESGYESHCITIFAAHNVTVKDMNLTIDGHDGKCVYQKRVYRNCRFIGGTWTNNSNSHTDRQYFESVAYQGGNSFENPTDTGDYHQIFDNVNVALSPHAAFAFGMTKILIMNCTLHVDAQNVKYDTLACFQTGSCGVGRSADNPYAIKMSGALAGTKIHHNVVTTGRQHQGGRGILLENCGGTIQQPILAYSNNLTLSNGPSGENADGWSRGVRVRTIDGGTADYVKVYDNRIVILADDNPATTAIGKRGVGLAFGIGSTGPHHLWIERNTVICSTLTAGTFETNAVEYGVDEGIAAPVACTVRYNHYRSGNNVVYFGDAYNGFSGHDLKLIGDTLGYLGNGIGVTTWYVGEDYGVADDIVAIDCKYRNGASDQDIEWRGSGSNEISLRSTLQVSAMGRNGLLVDGAQVTVTNNYGQTAASGTTSAGLFRREVTYRYESAALPDSTGFSPFRVRVTKSPDVTDSNITVSWDRTKVTVILPNTDGTITPGSEPLNNLSTFTPTLVANDFSGEQDSVRLNFTSGSDANPDSIIYCWSTTSIPDSANASRVSIAYSPSQSYVRNHVITVTDPDTLNFSYWTKAVGTTVQWSSRGTASLVFGDITPPGQVDSMWIVPGSSRGQLNLFWRAPGDDGYNGTAHHYEIRYSSTAINPSLWNSYALLSNPPAPVAAGLYQNATIGGLTPGQVYYAGIKAFDEASNASAVASRSGFAAGIRTPVPIASDVDSINGTATTTCSTVTSYMTLTYRFALDTVGSFATARLATGVINGATAAVTFDQLAPGTTYFWSCRAVAVNLSDTSSWSTALTFNLNSNGAPSLPLHVSPPDGDTVLDTPIVLVVENSIDPEGDTIHYDFWIYGDSLLTQVVETKFDVAEGPSQTGAQFTFTPANGHKYWWQVRARDTYNVTAPTAATWFIYASLPTGTDDYTAGAVSPQDGAVVLTNRPVLTADNIVAAGTNFYYFEVAADSGFLAGVSSSPAISEGDNDKTQWQVDRKLETGRKYYWRVRVNDYAYSNAVSFTVKSEVYASPNPVHFRKGEYVTFHLSDEPMDLLIQTVSGETVRLEQDVSGDWTWDGTNASGEKVAVGVYLWYVSGSSFKGKLMVKP
ncbi:MAG TPA: hypothetical protein VN285_07855 [Candidatus Deferrimicrobium sp.]|nr:hypothetical protein [Candidatus Deferrimicrobium sp.]